MTSTSNLLVIALPNNPHYLLNPLAWILDNSLSKLYRKDGRFHYMEGLKIMMFDEGADHKIRYRFVSKWFKVDSSMSAKEQIISEIERNCPDVVLLNPDLYTKIDVTETAKKIRSQFDIPVTYVC